jgi:hypothetical protein
VSWKELDRQVSNWCFKWAVKPLVVVAPYLRTNYRLDDQTLAVKHPFSRSFSIKLDEPDEIGAETTDHGPFAEDVFWVLKRDRMRLRIGDPRPIFQKLIGRFSSLEGFDWKPLNEAMTCTDNRYFVCWRRRTKA